MNKPKPRLKAAEQSPLSKFHEFGEMVTQRAYPPLLGLRPVPVSDAELAIHLAYADGMRHCQTLTLNEVEDEAKSLGISLATDLKSHPQLLTEEDLDAADLIARYYQDDRELPRLWERQPEIAEAMAFWQGMNDVYEFAVCFATRAVYEDDFRRIRGAVESALKMRGLLDIWNRTTAIEYAEFTPPRTRVSHTPPKRPPSGLII